MWSKAELSLFVRFAGFCLMLASGIMWAASAVAMDLFGYNGEYTPELVVICLLVSMVGSRAMLLRLKRSYLREEDIELIKECEDWRVTTAEDARASPIMRRAFDQYFNKRTSPPE